MDLLSKIAVFCCKGKTHQVKVIVVHFLANTIGDSRDEYWMKKVRLVGEFAEKLKERTAQETIQYIQVSVNAGVDEESPRKGPDGTVDSTVEYSCGIVIVGILQPGIRQ